jgi:ABC-type branched-subunit amino acid transport system substrate-binding protein
MKSTQSSFPPGAGWLPIAIVLAFALLASAFAITPQFAAKVLVDQTKGNAKAGTANGAGPDVAGGDTTSTDTNGGTAGGGTAGINGTAGTQGSTTYSGSGGGVRGGHASCSLGGNGGATAPGVTGNEIHVAATIVTSGTGSGFLGEAQDGIQAAINETNNKGGICGRRVTFEPLNSGWSRESGAQSISAWANSGKVFALVGQPDSEGLDGASGPGGVIDRTGLPVVGSDGLLKSQYHSPWIWPVASSTVANMHIIAKWAYDHGARRFGIVYDYRYKFGPEGAAAFDNEVKRLGGTIKGDAGQPQSCQGATAYCGISSDQQSGFSTYVNAFNSGCSPACDAVVMLLEPQPMEAWMRAENGNTSWYKALYGGEPLFDDNVANNCPGCGQAAMKVWTGYRPAIQPFDSEPKVAQYRNSLLAVRPSDDPHNEFTEGGYLGAKMFLAACQKVGDLGLPLTRPNLQDVLNGNTWDLGLSAPLSYGGGGLPHIANSSMAEFAENYSGSFNGWSYQNSGFVADPAKGQDQ